MAVRKEDRAVRFYGYHDSRMGQRIIPETVFVPVIGVVPEEDISGFQGISREEVVFFRQPVESGNAVSFVPAKVG